MFSNKKRTRLFVSALSAFIAFTMLSTTVFAGSVASPAKYMTRSAQLWQIIYNSCSKNSSSNDLSVTSKYASSTPEYIIEQFFKNTEIGNTELTKGYLKYQDMWNDKLFLQPQKVVSDIKVDNTKDALGQITAEVYVKTDSGEFIHWLLFLEQESSGKYLISGYASITDISFDGNGNLIMQFGNAKKFVYF